MPSRRPCLGPGPFHLSEPGKSRCKAHQPYAWPERPSMGSEWRGIRNRYITQHPRCEVCGNKATTVDHIKARALYGVDHSIGNLRSLCPTCAAHKDHLDREQGKARKR